MRRATHTSQARDRSPRTRSALDEPFFMCETTDNLQRCEEAIAVLTLAKQDFREVEAAARRSRLDLANLAPPHSSLSRSPSNSKW